MKPQKELALIAYKNWLSDPDSADFTAELFDSQEIIEAVLTDGKDRKYKLGDRLRKTKGSSWQGLVVGFYSTSFTPVGYAIESEREPGAVQIYPESALELVTDCKAHVCNEGCALNSRHCPNHSEQADLAEPIDVDFKDLEIAVSRWFNLGSASQDQIEVMAKAALHLLKTKGSQP